MLSSQIIDFGAGETYPIRQLAENYEQDNGHRFRLAAESLGITEFELAEFLTKPEERNANELSSAAMMMWWMSGVDIESDNGFANGNKLTQIGDMSTDEFDITPSGKLFWEICSQDWLLATAWGSETNPDMFNDEMDNHNPAHQVQNMGPPTNRNIYYDPTAPNDANHANVLGQLAAGEPWNEYQMLMWMIRDDWGPSIDWMDIAGGVMTTNKKQIEKKYRDMSFDESTMLRTGEMVQHMIAEVGFSKEKVDLQAHGIQFRASYDYITNPDISARDFRWEVERTGVAMKIVLFLQFANFLIGQAEVQPGEDTYGDLTNITAQKWLDFSKMPTSKAYNVFLTTPQEITKWQLAMMGNLGPNNQMSGVTQLMNAISRTRDSLQLNRGSRLPRYGWIDNIHSQELYNKFADSNDLGLNNGGGEKQALMLNKSSSSEIVFRRQSRQDESGRNTRERYVYRDLHTEWGIHRPENPLDSGAGTHRGKSNIIRTAIS